MDSSVRWYEDPIYIKMCEKAVEIQVNVPQDGVSGAFVGGNILCYHPSNYEQQIGISSGYYYFIDEEVATECFHCGDIKHHTKTVKCIWLPDQSQLQTMVSGYIAEQLEVVQCGRNELIMAFIDFSAWLGEQYYDEPFTCLPTNVFNSGEQLWLAFVYHELYHKIWNKEDWVLNG